MNKRLAKKKEAETAENKEKQKSLVEIKLKSAVESSSQQILKPKSLSVISEEQSSSSSAVHTSILEQIRLREEMDAHEEQKKHASGSMIVRSFNDMSNDDFDINRNISLTK